MNFQQLEYIVAVNDHRLFSEAAFSCKVTQATLSAMIIKLEKELGFQIFDRNTKPVTTTELGKELIEDARKMLALRNEISQIGKTIPSEIQGELSIGVIPTVANSLLPKIVPALLKHNPNLSLQVREITTEEIIRGLKTGTLDLGIAATPVQEKNIDEEILYFEPMMVYGVKDNKEFMVDDEMLSGKIWLLEDCHCFRQQVVTLCGLKKKDSEVENLFFEGNSFETLLSMVDTFGGYTLIPELYYLDMSEANKSKTRAFQKPIPVREISIISYKSSQRNQTIQYLSKAIRDLIVPGLSTRKFKNKDLRILGLN